MEDPKEKETLPEAKEKIEEKKLLQSEVDALVGQARIEGKKAFFKDLGIENVEDTKKALKELKKFQDSQQSDLEKITSDSEEKAKTILSLTSKLQDKTLFNEARDILSELDIDTKHNKTVLKLIDKTDLFDDYEVDVKELKNRIKKTIEEELPMLVTKDNKKLGNAKKDEELPKSKPKEYMQQKYGNSPFLKK